ncbi:Signal transduction response regulator [Minicystis rosea]|nr:Signal transduction response regulator [Minicystis rosea]
MADATSFLGRHAELELLRAFFAEHRPLLTLLGPAGMGKTRLAQRFASLSAGDWNGGVFFCDLTGARDEDAFLTNVARCLGLSVAGAVDEMGVAIGRSLATRGRLLLVLDNLEQLLPRAAAPIASWVALAPDAAILVTSRERMRVTAEVVHDLAPLPEAVDLFLDRARRVRPGFAPKEEEVAVIAEIAARLDRIPLAVELAAARAHVLSPREMLARMASRFELLTCGARDVDARKSTMNRAIRWSWDLLDAHERCALAAASMFRGGFSLVAAEHVLGGARAPGAPEVLDLVQSLCDKSLLLSRPAVAPGEPIRFAMYESIHAFAAERLAESGEAAAVARRHAQHYLDVADALRAAPEGHERALSRLAAERDNYRAILERSLPTEAMRAAVALDAFSTGDSLSPLETRHLTAAIDAAPVGSPRRLRAAALLARATANTWAGPLADAETDCREALVIAEAEGDHRMAAAAHTRLGYVHYKLGRSAEALAQHERALAGYGATGDVVGEVTTLQNLGGTLLSVGRRAEAIDRLEQSLALCRARGYPRGEVRARASIGYYHLERGAYEPARASYEQSLALARRFGVHRMAMLSTGYLGVLSFDHGLLDDALEYLATATVEAQRRGERRSEAVFLAFRGAVRAALGDVDGAMTHAGAAEALIDSDVVAVVVRLCAGHIDLARSREAAGFGDPAGARRHHTAAQARADAAHAPGPAGQGLIDTYDDARVALRILERAIADADAARSEPKPRSGEPRSRRRRVLLVPPDAAWFQLGAGPPVALAHRRVLRQILAALCDRAEASPGEVVDAERLIEAGWPAQKMERTAARNRLQVALATLRSLGLRDVLERHRDGYRLDPRVRVLRRETHN